MFLADIYLLIATEKKDIYLQYIIAYWLIVVQQEL